MALATLAAPVRAQEIGAELLVCSDSASFDCRGAEPEHNAATDLVDCISPVSEIRLSLDEDTEVAHYNLGFVSCNSFEYGGHQMWENCQGTDCLLYTSPSPRDQRGSRMPSSA